jgi:hypothetical protein
MALRGITLVTLAALASLSVACGGTADTSKGQNGATGTGGDTGAGGNTGTGGDATTGGCKPGTVQMGGACIPLVGADPCKNPIHTEYDGDTQCLEAPDPSVGFQMHYGPSNYDDPAEVAHYLIDPSEELVDCMFMKTPNDHDVHMNNYHVRLRPGTHHMITYVQPQVVPDSKFPEACNQGPGFTFLVGATALNTDISAVGKDAPPEYAGAAMSIPATSQAAVQMHFINTTDKPRLKEGWINALYVPDDQVKMEINPIVWLGGLGMNVQPHTVETLQATCPAVPADPNSPTGGDLSIITTVAHMHSHTTRVAAFIQRAGETEKHKFYEDYNWEEPTFVYYNTVAKNDPPDPVAKKTGGDSGDFVAHPGDVLSWECEVHNDGANDNLALKFSDKALTGEMCNIFGVFGPSKSPWQCLSF